MCSLAGISVLSKIKPLNVMTELPGHPDPSSIKGRLITLEFPNCYLISTYVVNAGVELKVASQRTRLKWHAYS
jgi:AP endonuclease-1